MERGKESYKEEMRDEKEYEGRERRKGRVSEVENSAPLGRIPT